MHPALPAAVPMPRTRPRRVARQVTCAAPARRWQVGRILTAWLLTQALAAPLVQAAAPDGATPNAPVKLPALGASTSQTTVSGISSGGFMALQYGVAHSASVSGIAVVAGGPFACAQGQASTAITRCMRNDPPIDVPKLVQIARDTAAAGRIDPLSHLQSQRFLIFSGGKDTTVYPGVGEALERWISTLAPQAQRTHVRDPEAAHTMPTQNFGPACGVEGPPYLNDCKLDLAGRLLRHLLPDLKTPETRPAGMPPGQVIAFRQADFVDDLRGASLNDTGWLYVPQSCQQTSGCRIHVAFHGCQQYPGFTWRDAKGREQRFGRLYVEQAGYNRWADANRLIVLYPQATARTLNAFEMGNPLQWHMANPNGCWDWWGYTGPNYHTRDAVQIRAVRRMLERLAAAPARS